ncbi:unnamed protein product, partial [Protopolystoma xenopodis]
FLSSFTGHAHPNPPVIIGHDLLPALQVPGLDLGQTEASLALKFDSIPMSACPPSSRIFLKASGQTNTAGAMAAAAAAEEASIALVEPPAPGIKLEAMRSLKKRLRRAFCQPGNVLFNPCLEIYRLFVLPCLRWQAGLRPGDVSKDL